MAEAPERRVAPVDRAVVNRIAMPCPGPMPVRDCVDSLIYDSPRWAEGRLARLIDTKRTLARIIPEFRS